MRHRREREWNGSGSGIRSAVWQSEAVDGYDAKSLHRDLPKLSAVRESGESINRVESTCAGILAALRILADTSQRVAGLVSLLESTRRNVTAAAASMAETARITGSVSGLSETDVFPIAVSRTIDVSDGCSIVSIISDGAITIRQILDHVNAASVLRVSASLTGRGSLRLEATGYNAIAIGGSAKQFELAWLGMRAGIAPAGRLSEIRAACARQFECAASQIDQLVSDVSVRGVNLLNRGFLTVKFGDDALNYFSVIGVDCKCSGLGVVAPIGDFQTDGDIQRALVSLEIAIAALQSHSIVFASATKILRSRLDLMRENNGEPNAEPGLS